MTISAFIRQDLLARLHELGAAEHLTLQGLARHYGVSTRPVRAALDELIRAGVIEKQANGRLVVPLKSANDQAPPASLPHPVPPRNWEKIISDDVIHRSATGRADYLREEATAARFGVGRTVIRAIFNRLAGKGILEYLPRRGWRVRPFQEEQFDAYLQAREALELKALELARPRLERADLERLLTVNAPVPPGQPPLFDDSLHAYWIERSGNFYIQEFIERHGSYYTTLFDFTWLPDALLAASAQQHRDILEALLARRWRRGSEALATHIRAQRTSVRCRLEQLSARQ
jgi:DNA-binding GntR family transcriptional regulator